MLAVDERKRALRSVKAERTCTTLLVVVGENHKRRVARRSDGGEFCRSAFLVEALYVYALRSALVGVSAYYHCEIVAGKRL